MAKNYRELGINLIELVKTLLKNQNLCKLLYYKEPNPLQQPDIENTLQLFNDLISVVPIVSTTDEARSRIIVLFPFSKIDGENRDVRQIMIKIFVYVPVSQWMLNSGNMRPFQIMSELQETLNNKRLKGIGSLEGGNFELDLVTENMSCFVMEYVLDVFN